MSLTPTILFVKSSSGPGLLVLTPLYDTDVLGLRLPPPCLFRRWSLACRHDCVCSSPIMTSLDSTYPLDFLSFKIDVQ